MRRARLAALSAVALQLAPAPAAAQVAYNHMRATGQDVRMTKIAPGIFQFTILRDSYVRQLNSIAIETDRDVLVFDTGTRPSSARIILGCIRALTHKPVRYVVNSHGHPDHWSANDVYADADPRLDVIASSFTAAAKSITISSASRPVSSASRMTSSTRL